MDQATFVNKFGGVFENSAWVAESAFDHGGSLLKYADSLGALFESVFLAADPALQLQALKAHPQPVFAGTGADDLAAGPPDWKAGGGLDRTSAREFARFSALNREYSERFGFPFIIAVRGLVHREILESLLTRLQNDRTTEFRIAVQESCRIARVRIEDILGR